MAAGTAAAPAADRCRAAPDRRRRARPAAQQRDHREVERQLSQRQHQEEVRRHAPLRPGEPVGVREPVDGGRQARGRPLSRAAAAPANRSTGAGGRARPARSGRGRSAAGSPGGRCSAR
jgi:hypothetical protein